MIRLLPAQRRSGRHDLFLGLARCELAVAGVWEEGVEHCN